MEFLRQEYWSGLPFLSPGDLPRGPSQGTQGSNLCLLCLLHWQEDLYHQATGASLKTIRHKFILSNFLKCTVLFTRFTLLYNRCVELFHLARLKLYSVNNFPSATTPNPARNSHSYFCLCEFDFSRYLRCGIMQYLSLCDWLTSLSKMTSGVTTMYRRKVFPSFFLKLNNIPF